MGLQPFLTHPALDQTILPFGIIRALGAAIATATTAAAAVVTRDHTAPREAVPAADVAGAIPGGDPDLRTHRDPGPPGIAAIDHRSSSIPFSRSQAFPTCFEVSQQETTLRIKFEYRHRSISRLQIKLPKLIRYIVVVKSVFVA